MRAVACAAAYASAGYARSVVNFWGMTLAGDMVFSDGAALETPVVTGSAAAGYVASLTVAVPT